MEFRCVRVCEFDNIATVHEDLFEKYADLATYHLPININQHPEFPFFFYAIEKGKLAAYFRSFPDQLFYAGNVFNWAWNGNLYTFPDFRRRGLAQAIVEKQIIEFARLNTVWGGVFSAPAALRLYEKLRFSMAGIASRLFIVRDIRAFSRYYVPKAQSMVLESIYRGLSGLTLNILRKINHRRQRVQISEIEPADFETNFHNKIIFPNNVAFWGSGTSWITLRMDILKCDKIILLRADQDNEPFAFALIRKRVLKKTMIKRKFTGIEMMTVMHFGRFDDRTNFSNLFLSGIVDYFLKNKAEMLEVVTSDPDIEDQGLRYGFVKLGDGMSFKFKAPKVIEKKLPAANVRNFFLTHYSGDAFSFE